ncbi:latent-transforming growth factor beta-binding protein 1 [Lingula anatina]|uniref:Latent-transforming growth factor beta-binding protein 1 n=1 Tax=Lingula anatina TaxID=7574 RepID=A0A1S3JCQ2_LINAN|nr:latent-transforming growth factor beta-binding protein 1 [Lingula anatina]XP_013407664.1 latent-transforming growth factor beta-binding protein 1 [Lingula anatina]|eukprot:XP_013407663.1 latent-transforming growth factor beta-binding protein 1 [Lingula anatina]
MKLQTTLWVILAICFIVLLTIEAKGPKKHRMPSRRGPSSYPRTRPSPHGPRRSRPSPHGHRSRPSPHGHRSRPSPHGNHSRPSPHGHPHSRPSPHGHPHSRPSPHGHPHSRPSPHDHHHHHDGSYRNETFEHDHDFSGLLQNLTAEFWTNNTDSCYCNENPCAINNGGCEDLCVNTYAGHYCACSLGYQLVAGENDTTSCEYEITCVALNEYNQLLCICEDPNGRYPVNGTRCQDKDECIMESPCQDQCTNTIGSFFCNCSDGYRLSNDSKTCVDINECAIPEMCSAICINTPGDFFCLGIGGFLQNGRKKRAADMTDFESGDIYGDFLGEQQESMEIQLQQLRIQLQENMRAERTKNVEQQFWQSMIYLLIAVIAVVMSLILMCKLNRFEKEIERSILWTESFKPSSDVIKIQDLSLKHEPQV